MSVTAADLDRSLRFYRDLLGLEMLGSGETDSRELEEIIGLGPVRLRWAELDLGEGQFLELFEYVSPRGKALEQRTADAGSVHIALAVDDVDGLYQRLSRAGVTMRSAPVELRSGDWRGAKALYSVDPDGVTVELVEFARHDDDTSAPARRPLIGITSYLEEARWGVWQAPAALVPSAYVQAVERAGGRALVVPPNRAGAREVAAALDGLLLSGGGDIEPRYFGESEHPELVDVDAARDDGELALLCAALELDLPVLGICRGMQLLNVAAGGDLVPHVPDRVAHDGHKLEPGAFHWHDVRCAPGSAVARMLGERTRVPSHHHQAVGKLGARLVAVAFADDGLIEAIEDPERRFCIGVQWHPEEADDDALFVALVERARERPRAGA